MHGLACRCGNGGAHRDDPGRRRTEGFGVTPAASGWPRTTAPDRLADAHRPGDERGLGARRRGPCAGLLRPAGCCGDGFDASGARCRTSTRSSASTRPPARSPPRSRRIPPAARSRVSGRRLGGVRVRRRQRLPGRPGDEQGRRDDQGLRDRGRRGHRPGRHLGAHADARPESRGRVRSSVSIPPRTASSGRWRCRTRPASPCSARRLRRQRAQAAPDPPEVAPSAPAASAVRPPARGRPCRPCARAR